VADGEIQREVLPVPDRSYPGLVTYDAKDPDTEFPPIRPLRPPGGAPNVVVVLLDDVGFGASSAFGGPVSMPTAKRLAAQGLKYTRFHTTALCSPTRAALLSGRNHHAVGMGGITEIATSAPGYSSVRPNTCAPLAETLKLNGYATAHFGKCHEVPVWETSPAGPFDRWPSPGNGFEHFYGFIGGETNQYYPALYEGTTPAPPTTTPEQGYHLMPDLADKAIAWVRQQKALTPDQPFFVYFAPGATHPPHHVPKEWADKYKGKFDQGWDRLREETFARQKELGVVPQDCELTRRHDEISAWDDIDEQLKPVLARQMENYAGFLEYCRQPSSGASTWSRSAAPSPIPTTRSAGRTPCAAPTSGPSRSPPTGAAPATPPSSTGRSGSTPGVSCATSSTTSSTSLRPCWRPPGYPSPCRSTGSPRSPCTA
jgi:arylsulfatase